MNFSLTASGDVTHIVNTMTTRKRDTKKIDPCHNEEQCLLFAGMRDEKSGKTEKLDGKDWTIR